MQYFEKINNLKNLGLDRKILLKLTSNKSKLIRKSVFKPNKFLANLLINKSIKRTYQAYSDIQKFNDEFYNQWNKD